MLTPGKADLIEWTGLTLIRRDGASGKPVWDASRPTKPGTPKRDPGRVDTAAVVFRRRQAAGHLGRARPDLDGDGTADIVWAVRHAVVPGTLG